MRIPKFEIRNERGIRYVECTSVPSVMVIAGPNGSGKSTLLNALRTLTGATHVMYMAPHRATQRQRVQQRHLSGQSIALTDLLTQAQVPGYEGITLRGGPRDPWGYDDATNYTKHALCQIELDRREAIAGRFDRAGAIAEGEIPDPWEPLKTLTQQLLPHLRFHSIDTSNRELVLCRWEVHRSGDLVDFDELSSGEKSIIQMFYPLVERQMKQIMADMRGEAPPEGLDNFCVLIDEPELHLHPNLQHKVVDYLRYLASDAGLQVIMATHSPSIVEHATFDELFLLRPPELVTEGENQLIQVADDEERLRFLRDVFGSLPNLTALQPIVIVEGVSDASRSVMTDRKLFRALHSDFDRVTLIAGGGKQECLALLASLQAVLRDFTSNLIASALLDRDLDRQPESPSAHHLPVSMIENFLLDPEAIWQAIQSVNERAGFDTEDAVEHALDKLLDSMEPNEIDRRTKSAFRTFRFRASDPMADLPERAAAFAEEVVHEFSSERIGAARADAEAAVRTLRETNTRRENFHGKTAIDLFHRTYLHQTGLSNPIFKYEAARQARRRKSVTKFFDDFFKSIRPDA